MRPVAATCIVLLMLCCHSSYGQGENNIWCFGNQTGLDFNANPPVPYINSVLSSEGCATVCDASGNMLFYSGFVYVYDRNNNVMPNGSGLLTTSSSTQGTAIVQSFSNPDQYYLFTLESWEFPERRLFYSVIDMTLNGGLGDVVAGQKNILLDSNMSEKMIVIEGAGCYNWLLVHKNSEPVFHAYKIDAAGIAPLPVVSNSGFANYTDCYIFGEMKVSPNDSNIALANTISTGPALIELHSFNNATGQVNNAISLDTFKSYGISYSPDGSKLYVATSEAALGALYQYDLSLMPNVPAVKASKTNLVASNFYGMKIGPDEKIYIDKNGSVSVINNPNLAGPACSLLMNAYNISSYLTLGNTFVPNLLGTAYYSHDTTICSYPAVTTVAGPAGYTTYLWSDGNTGQSDTFSAGGTKWVLSTLHCTIRVDTFHFTFTPADTTTTIHDTNVCFVNNIPVFSVPGGYDSYLWSDGNGTDQDTMSQPGTKWVQYKQGCSVIIDTFYVHDWRDTAKMSTDTTHCVAYSPIPVTAPGGYTSYMWSDGHVGQTDTFFNSTTKWVTALNGCNMLIDTVRFTATTIPQDSITMYGGDTTICFEGVTSVNVTGPAGYTYYLWNDGAATQTDVFNGPGTKWVYAQKLCYLLVDTFKVITMPTDTTTGSTDTTVCFTGQVSLSAINGYDTYLWSDGNTGQSDTFTQTGIKEVYAHKACSEGIDTFSVQFINDLVVNLGHDTALCKGQSITLNATSAYATATYLWQDGRTAATYNVTDGGDYSVSVSVGPCIVNDTVRIHQKTIDILLGNGLIPCNETSIVLDPKAEGSYLWQDGSTNKTYTATKEGAYTVKVTKDECSATESVTVRFASCPCNVVLPTAFSPNNDSRNDKFGATISCAIKSYKLMVYNRWGNQVFYSEQINEKWDGTMKGVPVDGDVFNYYLEFKDAENKVYYYKGDVTLVR